MCDGYAPFSSSAPPAPATIDADLSALRAQLAEAQARGDTYRRRALVLVKRVGVERTRNRKRAAAARRVAAYCRELRKTRRSSLQRIDPAEIAAALADAEKLRVKRMEWLDEAPERWLDDDAQPPAPATPPGGE